MEAATTRVSSKGQVVIPLNVRSARADLSRHLLVETVLCIGNLVEVTDGVGVEIQDPADEKFLECSLSSDADYLVSGDKHLLRVGVVERTRIVSVAEFVEILRGRTPLSSRV